MRDEEVCLFPVNGSTPKKQVRARGGIAEKAKELFQQIEEMSLAEKVRVINQIKRDLHEVSPFKGEPVDCVTWVLNTIVGANSYNPNSVAPVEMALLETSILQDGYTQPIVGWFKDEGIEVVDGFHRNRVGKESQTVRERVHGYLPVVKINTHRQDLTDRMAATIRHNRARGKHKVEAMSDIVIELKRRNWSDDKIARELGMDADEVLRLCQITGLAEMFKDQDFSKSWDVEDFVDDGQPVALEDEEDGEPTNGSDSKRIYHTFEHWECYPAGFYEEKPKNRPKATKEELEREYADFLGNDEAFNAALERVITEWPKSCEHYLSNENMNRIAWLGQASACLALGIPSVYRGGYHLLSETDQKKADQHALDALNRWLSRRGEPEIPSLEDAESKTQANLY